MVIDLFKFGIISPEILSCKFNTKKITCQKDGRPFAQRQFNIFSPGFFFPALIYFFRASIRKKKLISHIFC
ncbi:MAG: hypothetical protein C0168_04920 [Candidatus Aminicenantes bacterium]|nr:MAG: hypothetical protein C0168_04920 [Candidatus Aminicenantes bacterium]